MLALTALMVDFIIFGFFGRFWWVFDLLANFQMYYCIAAAFGLAYFLIRGRWAWALMPLAALIVTGWMIFSVHVGGHDSAGESNADMRILFYNMFAYNVDYDVIADYIHDIDPDVVIVAEMVEHSFDEIGKRLPEYAYGQWEDGVSTGGDIGFFSKIEPDKIEVLNFNERFHLPWFRFEFTIDEQQLVVYAIHPSPPMNAWLHEARTVQLNALAQQVRNETDPVIVIGDFNTTPYSPVFRKLLRDTGLRDSRRGFGVHASWPNWLPNVLRIPIDHALVSDGVAVKDRKVGPSGKGSDHVPLLVDISF